MDEGEKRERYFTANYFTCGGAGMLMRYDNIGDLFTNNIVKDG